MILYYVYNVKVKYIKIFSNYIFTNAIYKISKHAHEKNVDENKHRLNKPNNIE